MIMNVEDYNPIQRVVREEEPNSFFKSASTIKEEEEKTKPFSNVQQLTIQQPLFDPKTRKKGRKNREEEVQKGVKSVKRCKKEL